MARTFLTPIDLSGNEIRNALAHVLASDPGAPTNGQFWYNSTDNAWRVRAGGATITVGGGVTTEDIQDAIGTMLSGNTETGIAVTYNDAGNVIDFVVDAEFISDTVGAMITGNTETGITVTYDDADNTLDFVLDNEYLQDTIGAMVAGGTESGITVSYDDTNARFDFTVTDSPLLGGQNSAYHLSRTNHTGTQLFSTVTTTNTDRLLGRDTAGGGAVEEISLNSTLEWTGSASIQRAALTGDVTATAGSNTTAIAAGVIVDADVNASAAIAATKLAFSPTGNISSTTVQAAIAELETDLTALINTTVQGQIWKNPVDAATTTALPNSPTYNSGAGTLTAGSNVAFGTIDGVASPAVGMDYLVKDQSSTFQNGIYTLTTLGSGAAPWVLTRRADANVNTELQDAAVMIEAGTVNRGRVYTQVNAIADLTSATQSWVLTNENQVYTGSSTITLTGQAFSVTANSISETHLTTSVAGGGLLGGNGTVLSVNTGTASATLLEISGDTVRISADASGNGLTGGAGSPLAVGAGNGITVNANDVALASSTAGAGITYTTGVLAVGAGNGITVNADDVALASSTAGAGLTYTTGVLAVGAGTGITVNADDIQINTSVVARKAVGALTGGATSEVLTHNLGTRDVTVQVINNATPWEHVEVDVESTSTNTVTVRSSANLPASYRWIVVG